MGSGRGHPTWLRTQGPPADTPAPVRAAVRAESRYSPRSQALRLSLELCSDRPATGHLPRGSASLLRPSPSLGLLSTDPTGLPLSRCAVPHSRSPAKVRPGVAPRPAWLGVMGSPRSPGPGVPHRSHVSPPGVLQTEPPGPSRRVTHPQPGSSNGELALGSRMAAPQQHHVAEGVCPSPSSRSRCCVARRCAPEDPHPVIAAHPNPTQTWPRRLRKLVLQV